MVADAPRPRREQALNVAVVSIVAAGLSLAIASVYGTEARPVTAVEVGRWCIGPLLPWWFGQLPRTIEAAIMWTISLLPFTALVYGYGRLKFPASTVILALAATYWVLVGWAWELELYS